MVEEAGAGVTLVACECPDPVVLSLRLVPVMTSSGSGNLSPVGENGERGRLKEEEENVKREVGRGNYAKRRWGWEGEGSREERAKRKGREGRKLLGTEARLRQRRNNMYISRISSSCIQYDSL